MTDVLSQNEIDQLLSAISSSDSTKATSSSSSTQSSKTKWNKIKIYDFKRPDKFSKDQLRTIQIIQESFARMITSTMATTLRTKIEMHVSSVDQLTYEEFRRSIPNPTALCIFEMTSLNGSAILEIEPLLTFSIIDRLFGGKGEYVKINRELTNIEKSALEGIYLQFLTHLREAWSSIFDIRPRLNNLETNPQFVQLIPPNEIVVLITFDTKIQNVEGMINICIPYITIEPIIQKLSSRYWPISSSDVFSEKQGKNFSDLKKLMENVESEISFEVGSVDIKIKDLLNLKIGSVVKLENTLVTDTMVLKVNDRPKFTCRPARLGKKLAVQIEGKIEELEEEFLIDLSKNEKL